MSATSPRIAILGFSIEVNRFSPISTAADFSKRADISGDEIIRNGRELPCITSPDLPGFFKEMDRTGEWIPIPMRLVQAQPGGPVDQAFFDSFLSDIDGMLLAAGELDGVYVVAHGAGACTDSHDPDGDLLAAIRARVGPDVPVIAVFDLHANVSSQMVKNLDVFVGYLENPHTDIRARGIEAAQHMRRLLAGEKTAVAMVKLPLTPPSITLLTAEGPYADIIRYGQSRLGGDIINVSVMAGFVFSDCTKNGYTVVVTARNANHEAAQALALDIASRTWAERERYRKTMTSLDDAIALAVKAGRDTSAASILLADVADNPGGGGRGNTAHLLQGLIAADAQGVVLGVFNDSPLAEDAHAAGVGAQLKATFNRAETDSFSESFSATATVMALSDGEITGRRGMLAGLHASMGPSARLRIGGVDVVVISNRQQCLDPVQFESLGVDLSSVRTLVLKSRGHFRAGYDEFFTPERIYEVDCPGLTSPSLHLFDWAHLPRPSYPIDLQAQWQPPELATR